MCSSMCFLWLVFSRSDPKAGSFSWLPIDRRIDFADLRRAHAFVKSGGVWIRIYLHRIHIQLCGSLHCIEKQLLANASADHFRSHPQVVQLGIVACHTKRVEAAYLACVFSHVDVIVTNELR